MSDEERLRIDFAEGVGALDRTMRAITMIAREALDRLLELGWTRNTVNLKIDPTDPLPCYITLRRKRVFVIEFVSRDGSVEIVGRWLKEPSAPGIIDKFWGV